jgi:competence protein ComEA
MPRFSRSQLVAYAVIGIAVLLLGGRWLMTRSGAHAGAPAPAFAQSSAAGSAEPGVRVSAPSRAAVVHVAGAVRRPGVYRLGAGARVKDAVRRAGGPTPKADVNAINLAAVLQDGVQVVVPAKLSVGVVATAAVPTGAPGAPPAAPVNLNTATAEQLDTLDGVGPSTAQKILDYRKEHGGFRSVEDLGQVSGIGPKRMEALRGKVVV